jgi:putative hydrolase of the HAD superfamily
VQAFDGTFHDLVIPFYPRYRPVYQAINQQVWREFENGQITAEALRLARFERLFRSLDMEVDAEQFSQRYLARLAQSSDLLPGARGIIDRLRGKYHLALITNGLKDVQRPRLAGSPIADAFEVVAISEEIGAAKPDPLYFTAVFECIGSPAKERVLVIGDSLTSDIQGGANFGLDTCWFNPGGLNGGHKLQATYEIRQLGDLFGILEN